MIFINSFEDLIQRCSACPQFFWWKKQVIMLFQYSSVVYYLIITSWVEINIGTADIFWSG